MKRRLIGTDLAKSIQGYGYFKPLMSLFSSTDIGNKGSLVSREAIWVARKGLTREPAYR